MIKAVRGNFDVTSASLVELEEILKLDECCFTARCDTWTRDLMLGYLKSAATTVLVTRLRVSSDRAPEWKPTALEDQGHRGGEENGGNIREDTEFHATQEGVLLGFVIFDLNGKVGHRKSYVAANFHFEFT